MNRASLLGLLVCLLASACSQSAPASSSGVATTEIPAPTAEPTAGATSAPAPAPGATDTATPVPSATLVGAWASPKCGERSYERHIDFAADGKFSADERISPCPPKVACVWSGIVSRQGQYEIVGKSVRLSAAAGPDNKAAKVLPAELSFEGGALNEVLADGTRCAYQRR